MPPGLEDGLRDGRAVGRVPGDLGDPGPGDGRQPGIIQRAGAPAGGRAPGTRLVTSQCADGRSLLTAVRLGDRSGAFVASLSSWRIGCRVVLHVVPGGLRPRERRTPPLAGSFTPGHLGIGLAAWRCGLFRLR